MADSKPPLTAELVWSEQLQFDATSGGASLVVDGDSKAGASPMQFVAIGVAGCMAADVVSILQKGRHPMTGLRTTLSAERLPEPPRRFVSIDLHFHITGAVPEDAIKRAIDLSRDKYCSAWNALRQDVALTTAFTVTP
jgi:putative redox protein